MVVAAGTCIDGVVQQIPRPLLSIGIKLTDRVNKHLPGLFAHQT